MNSVIKKERITLLKEAIPLKGPVVYWMSRDQRSNDNWALLFAKEKAFELKQPLVVIFCLVDNFLGANLRHYMFMLRGLREVENNLKEKNIEFRILKGVPDEIIPAYLKKLKAGILVTDFDPLKIKRKWKEETARKLEIPFYEVDAHNIVPARIASRKKEFGAYTLRPKIKKLLPDYLEDIPALKRHFPAPAVKIPATDWEKIFRGLEVDTSVPEISWLKPGESHAHNTLKEFIERKLPNYNSDRNLPEVDGTSNLSPYLHFGQISAQRVALEVSRIKAHGDSRDAFLEELIVRRELSDNYCFFNKDYDTFEGFPDWAKKTLNAHKKDKREYLYTLRQFEEAKTHDELWNAAQAQMVTTGKMHGYMRMYWAKKILEWTENPKEALKTALYLNDKYELDGRDPNGYVGTAWAIGGVHDRAWPERKIFGKIRYMSYNGCKSKFDVKKYIEKYKF